MVKGQVCLFPYLKLWKDIGIEEQSRYGLHLAHAIAPSLRKGYMQDQEFKKPRTVGWLNFPDKKYEVVMKDIKADIGVSDAEIDYIEAGDVFDHQEATVCCRILSGKFTYKLEFVDMGAGESAAPFVPYDKSVLF